MLLEDNVLRRRPCCVIVLVVIVAPAPAYSITVLINEKWLGLRRKFDILHDTKYGTRLGYRCWLYLPVKADPIVESLLGTLGWRGLRFFASHGFPKS